jgi:3-deoxy-D-manno-octulosonate 8-phosphate phosphatase (KDO 8-P phosphatase)
VTPGAEHSLATFMPALRRVRMLVLDVDGVLTDGRLYYGTRGEALKVFHVRDGHGIKQLAAAEIAVAIISGRKSAAVTRRARELGIRHVAQGVTDKLASLARLARTQSLSLEQCACLGDDTPDAPMMQAAGVAIAVADAHRDALGVADLVTARPGGRGAVREVCDWLLDARRLRA